MGTQFEYIVHIYIFYTTKPVACQTGSQPEKSRKVHLLPNLKGASGVAFPPMPGTSTAGHSLQPSRSRHGLTGPVPVHLWGVMGQGVYH